MTTTEAPTVENPPLGQTGRALRTANDTITRMHVQAIAQRRELEDVRTERNHFAAEVARRQVQDKAIALLRDCLAEAEQDNEILRGELATAQQRIEDLECAALSAKVAV